MCDAMNFPDTVDEFMETYKIVDSEQVYTNGAELVPIFRMKQWFEHLPSVQPEQIARDIATILENEHDMRIMLKNAEPSRKAEWCYDCKEYDQERHCCPRFNRVIRNTVEEIKAEHRWIPVTEILPEECKSVLICINDGDKYCIDVSYRTDYNLWERYGRVNVTAWMPLPEPYTEVKSNDNDQ